MTRLFSPQESPKLNIATEKFSEYYNTSSLVSQEAISDFFYSLKDSIANTVDRLFSGDLEKAAIDASSNKYEVLNVARRIHIAHLSDEVVTTPERFKGQYTEYLKTLTEVSEDMMADTVQLLGTLKMAVAGFINEYKEGSILTIYGATYVKASETKQKKHQASMSKFFPLTKATSKTEATNVIRSLGDIETIYRGLPALSSSVSSDKVTAIQKLAREVSDMIDILIEQNKQSSILSKNSSAKKQFIDMVHIGAKNVEFCGYLYANAIFFYTAVKSLSDAVIIAGNR